MSPLERDSRKENVPRVRTRQGCWSCRKRRRKSQGDETKPRCQNCAAKNLKCKYGVRLTFHEENLHGLDPEEARALKQHESITYQHVQFVDGLKDMPNDTDHYHLEDDERIRVAPQSFHPRTENRQTDIYNITESLGVCVEPKIGGLATDYGRSDSNIIAPSFNVKVIQWNGDHDPGSNPAYELNGFSCMQDADNNSANTSQQSPFTASSLNGVDHELNQRLTPTLGTEPSPVTILSNQSTNANLMTSQYLLKFFIDKVAPWLDLCTPKASYTIHLPLLSSKHSLICQAMIALASCQSARDSDSGFTDSLVESVTKDLGSDFYSCREESIAVRHLLYISELQSKPPQQWRETLINAIPNFDELGIHGGLEDIRGTACWLMLRFDLATVVLSRMPLLSNLKQWHQNSPPLSISTQLLDPVKHLQRSLLLCSQIADLYSRTTENEEKLESWNFLCSQFQTLRTLQSGDMLRPLLESPIGSLSRSKSTLTSINIPSSFALHVHTSRVSFYVSFLHHLTNILLIESKPRRVEHRAIKEFKPATWHAVRICGLSLSNPILWSWDPVVVAALMHAGCMLSHAGQQKDILEHLRRLEKLTGWEFGQNLKELEEFWMISQ